jgi:ribosomal protein S18 acetylase RimI-like enzyme
MFLRANLRGAGLDYRGEAFQALYVAGFRGEDLIGVAAHAWNGMVLLQAPESTDTLARDCVARSRRQVTGFFGPAGQVQVARAALGLADAPSAIDEAESLYALDLTDLRVPAEPVDVTCRAPSPDERELLVAWRRAYDIEVCGGTDSEDARARSAGFLDAQLAKGDVRVAIRADGVLVSSSAFNASLPDIVQLGGIYTPPGLRGRGYAKIAVAASLLAAREQGVSRAVLFTSNPSAIRTYEALGFRRIGQYGLVFLK